MTGFKVNCALLLSLLSWASAFVGIRIGLMDYSPGALALLRFLVASFCMALIYFFLPDKKRLLWTDRLQLMLIGVLGIGIYNTCLNYGEQSVSAGLASFVIGLIPVCTIIMSVLFFKERPNGIVWFGIGVSFLGLLFMLAGESAETSMNSGVLIILVSSLMGGIYNVSQKHYLRRYHSVAVTAWVIWGGTLMLMFFSPDLLKELPQAGYHATLAGVYMGIFPGALAYVAWTYVLARWTTSKAATTLYALPMLSTLLGFLVLHEQPSSISLTGGVVALMGALIANRFKNVRFSMSRTVEPEI